MSTPSLRELLAAAEEQYRLLLEEATALLRDFDRATPEDMDGVVARRADVMASLQNIDSGIRAFLATPSGAAARNDADLDAYRTLQEETTRRILEIDSLVIGLARERLDHLQQEMGALSRGKTAVRGYESSGRGRGHRLDNTA